MKEDSIEDDIKNAEHFIDSIKTDKEYKEENGWHGYYNKEIVELARISEHILSDYKRVLKENEEIRESNKKLYEIGQEMCKQDKYTSENYIPVQKVKDKIEHYKKILLSCNRFSDVDRIKAINERILELQELIESEEK